MTNLLKALTFCLSEHLRITLLLFAIPFLLNFKMLPERGPDPGQVCLRVASSARILDFVLEEFPKTSPGDFEGMFIKPGHTTTPRGLE